MSRTRRSIFISVVGLIFVGCASPMAKMEPKIAEFKKKFPDHIQTYQGETRQMQFAWTGDVNAPPILFVHGSPGEWGGWIDFLMDENLQKHFHLIAVDRPGYGGSGSSSELSLRNQAEEIARVLQFNHSGKAAILIGHSYGGAVIAQIAVDHPAQVSDLIFVASSVDPSLEETKWYQYPATWWPLRVLIPNALRVCNEEIMALKDQLILLNPRWNEIKANVVSIQGTDDNLVPLANQDFILSHLSKEQVKGIERVQGMNHFIPWQHSELILQAIEKLRAKN